MTYKIALIPARGGSKRLPDKNIKLLNGKPLIAWTIIAAKESALFDEVIVSTDSENIAAIAKHYGANVPFIRPQNISNDNATTAEVVNHAVNFIQDVEKVSIDTICLLQPTSPLRTTTHIKEAFALYKEKKAKSVISVCKVEHSIQLCNKLSDTLSMEGFIKPENNIRSQEHAVYYRLNGAIYIFDKIHFKDISKIYDKNSYAYIMNRTSSIDIDEKEDFIFAESLLRLQ
ncbi:pseudaminic acid cytidylyltransferase [Enterobacter hormaechei]|uniref:pseudaminic acid cytidylyltransferase n=1 Tax=Enterobacter hormaechei TaxID=158836 RepID=UPI002290BD21|nr:pseudaminic acid cytidylyltransferase [Enterobacter hormaechei]HCT5795892.1 pseudaminic acid cytidylyltransferase [Enterobacter hormaechei]